MRLSFLPLLLGGVAIGGLAVFAAMPDAPAAAHRTVAPRSSSQPDFDALAARLERIERRLAAAPATEAAPIDAKLAARLDRIEALLRDRPAAAPTGEPAAGVPLSTLRLRARGLSSDLTRASDAVDAWERVAARATDPEAKAEAWFEQGEVYRQLEDYAGAAEAWTKVVDTVGLQSRRGQRAAYQLAWAHAYRQDSQAAYRTFRKLAETLGLSKGLDASVRLQVAAFARASGDVDTARREYERFVTDYARDGEEHFRDLAATAAERLKELQ